MKSDTSRKCFSIHRREKLWKQNRKLMSKVWLTQKIKNIYNFIGAVDIPQEYR